MIQVLFGLQHVWLTNIPWCSRLSSPARLRYGSTAFLGINVEDMRFQTSLAERKLLDDRRTLRTGHQQAMTLIQRGRVQSGARYQLDSYNRQRDVKIAEGVETRAQHALVGAWGICPTSAANVLQQRQRKASSDERHDQISTKLILPLDFHPGCFFSALGSASSALALLSFPPRRISTATPAVHHGFRRLLPRA